MPRNVPLGGGGLSGEFVMAEVIEAAAEAINEVAELVYEQSQVEVPRGEEVNIRYPESLAESGRSPATDPALAAVPGHLEAVVEYNSPYAHAQHEGYAVMERENGPVTWEVTSYTTPGTKKKFLEDPLKAAVAGVEAAVAARIRMRLG